MAFRRCRAGLAGDSVDWALSFIIGRLSVGDGIHSGAVLGRVPLVYRTCSIESSGQYLDLRVHSFLSELIGIDGIVGIYPGAF